ncbi:MAG: hypothetical protein KDA41_04350, partial [Planctomycetales bacterium]|nr:hypothetical protein [Planctomycetales bacterium]
SVLLIFIGWSRFTTIRPENFAGLFFSLLVLLITPAWLRMAGRSRDDAAAGKRIFGLSVWLGVPLLMTLWANTHGSFPVGIAVLGCCWLGRVVDVAWRARSGQAVLADAAAWRWLWLTELAVAATLVNPYGIDLWIYTIQFAGNVNMRTILEWQPLSVDGVGGVPFAVSVVLLLVVWRQSRRAIHPAEVLLLALFATAALGGIRMLGWYAPVFAVVVAPHVAEIIARLWPRREQDEESLAATNEQGEYVLPPGQSFRLSLVALLLIWIVFALSPISQPLLHKTPRTAKQLYWPDTPLQVTEYLKEAYADGRLPGGQTFHPQWWGDWLTYAGPEGFQPFVTTNIHLAPRTVWRDYLRVINVQSGWEGTLDRYRVTTVVVDKEKETTMLSALNRSEQWRRVYEDDMAAVFVQSAAAPPPAESAAPAAPVEPQPQAS